MTEKAQKPQKNSKPIIVIIVVVILLLLIAFMGYLYLNKTSEVEGLVIEKEQIRNDLQSELDALLLDHNQIKKEYGILSDTLASRDSLIQANAKEIKNLLNYKWDYYQIKKKLDQLREVAKGYVKQMDSLYTVNQELKEENTRIRESFQMEQNKNTELKEEKLELEEIVENASRIRVYNIQSTGIRQRGSNQKETDKANRTDRVRVCFTLGENKLVDAGKKSIFVRIARPDKVILAIDKTDDYTFEYQGEKLQYSITRDIKYTGESKDICVYWNKATSEQEAMKGRYHVSVYMDNEVIGESYFELR